MTTLYDQDFYLWSKQTATALKAGKWQELDLPNLIEEVESMGKSQRSALRNNLRIVLMHLLKYKYQPERRAGSWL